MDPSTLQSQPWLFPVLFASLWFIVTSILGVLSRWYALMRAFPDRDENELMKLKGQSGSMSGVGMRGILNISVCSSGLRFGILQIFGPFCRDFLVPWEQLRIERKAGIAGKMATLRFGEPCIGWLRIPSHVADNLARSSTANWPEAGSFPEEPRSKVFASVFREWIIGTALASLFFTLVPRIAAPNASNYPPIALAILFPAVVLGIASVIRYFARIKARK